ncbi:hypothetical protein CI610_02062 [invertebrate metagenome]|uniref:Uncharacterized protein n=1 Tax=invertebrate metagenome TaxID=1711999 RepID=A0A2H9T701_9ZZZZ
MLIFSVSYVSQVITGTLWFLAAALTGVNTYQSTTEQASFVPNDVFIYHSETGFDCAPVFNCFGLDHGIELCHTQNGQDRCVPCEEGYTSTRNIKHSDQSQLSVSHMCLRKSQSKMYGDSNPCRTSHLIGTEEENSLQDKEWCSYPDCICAIDKCFVGQSACSCGFKKEGCPESYELDKDGNCISCRSDLGFYRSDIGCEGCMMNATKLELVLGSSLMPLKNNVLVITDVTRAGATLITNNILKYANYLRNTFINHRIVGENIVSEPSGVQLDIVVKMLDTRHCDSAPAEKSIFVFINDTPQCGTDPCHNDIYNKIFPGGFPNEAKKIRFSLSKQERQAQVFENDPIDFSIADQRTRYENFQGYWLFEKGKCPVVTDEETENTNAKTRRFVVDISTKFGTHDLQQQRMDDMKLYKRLKRTIGKMVKLDTQDSSFYESTNQSSTKLSHEVYVVNHSKIARSQMTLYAQ